MRLIRCLVLPLACLSGTGAGAGGASPGTMVQAASALSPAGLVSAVLAYTRWPARDRALVLCISRPAPDAAALQAQAEDLRLPTAVLTRLVEVDEPVPLSCDAVYFDRWSPPAQRTALQALAGRPVMSVGWGADFCSDGGLVCLSPGRSGLRFELNLDAVARSGLRVHPQVLRLTQPRPAERS